MFDCVYEHVWADSHSHLHNSKLPLTIHCVPLVNVCEISDPPFKLKNNLNISTKRKTVYTLNNKSAPLLLRYTC